MKLGDYDRLKPLYVTVASGYKLTATSLHATTLAVIDFQRGIMLSLRPTALLFARRYRVTAARWFTWLRVEAAAALLQLQGHGRLARKLRIGYAAYDTLNSESYDFDLRFSGSNARRLEGMLPEEERSNFPMVRAH